MEHSDEGRSARKRRAIMEAATALFLRNGYQRTSMDEVAARAAVSKQTVYKHFADKEHLFNAIVQQVSPTAERFLDEITRRLDEADDLERDLMALARTHVAAVLRPGGIQLRRLVIAEADRHPELARAYYERAPERVIITLADAFARLADRGLLRVDDPRLAAEQYSYLVLGSAIDRGLFLGPEQAAARAESDAAAGVRAFLAAYGATSAAPRRPGRRPGAGARR
jgi:TetR/AcrR family transcriptional regulator, mexJK operon transcriptional repressor